MEQNYYCDGKWFERYIDAKDYAESMQHHDRKYRVVYTKAEKDSIINAIDHELECGK